MEKVGEIRKVGVFYNQFLEKHLEGTFHIESPIRTKKVFEMVKNIFSDRVSIVVSDRKATKDELCLVHNSTYVDNILRYININSEVFLDPDTVLTEMSVDCALISSGLVLEAIDRIMNREFENTFVISRPPGHHATINKAMGFCIFNNVAISAKYLLEKYGLSRVAIVDFDVHHGNGTQDIFYSTDKVLYISTHRYPFYPGTGYFNQIGTSDGIGFTVNIPLEGFADNNDYAFIYSEIVYKVLKKFSPEILLVSAGFDSYYKDPLGGMNVTEEGFRHIANVILKSCDRCVFVLEGGYDPEGLSRCIHEVIEEQIFPTEHNVLKYVSSNLTERIMENFKKYIDDYWNIL